MKPLASYISFTGEADCYAELPLDVLAGATTFTIEVKFSTASTKNTRDAWTWGTIAGREIGYFGKDDGGLCVNGGKLCFWCSPASKGTSSSNIQTVTSSATVNDGEIHKVAVVSSNGAIDLYCDGVNVAHTDNVNAKITDAQTILLAYDSDSNSYLQMDLYEARFWNVARSAAEIFADITGTETGLQGWYLPTAEGLKDYSGNDRHATLYGNPAYTELTVLPVTLNCDVERFVKNDTLLLSTLKVWLPFNTSTTQDLCGNTWTATGSLTISDTNAIDQNALQLSSGAYLKSGNIAIGGQDFTIEFWAFGNTSQAAWAGLFGIGTQNNSNTNGIYFARDDRNSNLRFKFYGTNSSSLGEGTINVAYVGQRHHYALVYQHSSKKVSVFVDGVISNQITLSSEFPRLERFVYIGRTPYGASQYFQGSIDEFQIYDGVALHTKNFTPPTSADYAELSLSLGYPVSFEFTADVQRKVSNAVEVAFDVERTVKVKWRYVNAGDADDLIVPSTILVNLPATKSKTGSAFYQPTLAKSFDLPSTAEIWIKFDVYFDGSNRWRAYNGGSNGATGATAQTNGDFNVWINGANNGATANICKANQLQTVLLHMVSDSTAGIVEAWVDGTKIYTFTGDVNHGQDFNDIYLQSDGAGTFFSNVIISNVEIGLGEGFRVFSFDTERRVRNCFEIPIDIERNVIHPIYVPPIGEHFNHLVESIKFFRDKPTRIILPKKSVAYIRATGDGALRIFSDTDRKGKKTGEFYAQLDECNTVFIVPTDSPLRVIRDFVHALSETTLSGTEALDEAINYCTRGIFDTRSAVVEKFMNDLSGFDAFGYKTFLQDYCDINVANADTGAITGIDAGGGGEKTAQSIVPEPVPVEDWVVPVNGSSKTIHGLTINFPTSGASGALTDVEKHILAGLNSVWFDQCLKLVEKSFGLSFRDEDSTVKTINVEFENDSTNSALAYTAYTVDTTSGKTVALRLVINMWHYNSIDTGSADGAATYTLYLDRTLAHELTHAVMAANIDNFNSLPAFIKEGIAELVHGIDNTRRSDITALVTSKRSDLQTIISGINTEATNSYFYSAGYLFLRYLAKQGQNDSFAPQTLEITDLLISDGATDSDYNALTDNTRQIFYPDFVRNLIRAVEDNFDVEIFDTVPVEFLIDVKRALLARLILFPRNSEDFFQPTQGQGDNPSQGGGTSQSGGGGSSSGTIPPNTSGLQSFEVTIAEQQITDQVRFSAVIPFDIMQQVSGQYLDYIYNMRVERVQQQGILFSCDCCSDIDKLLYTQISYKIPPMTWYMKIDGEIVGESKTVEVETHYPPASEHVIRIAGALGLSPVMQFDDYQTTVLTDDLGGVTYNDLIRDVFGWTSRVPTQLINVYIREGKLFVIERGHESHSVDISAADKTLPVITKELVRTAWGSSITSTTNTHEANIPYFVPADRVIDSISGGDSGDDEEEQVREIKTEFSGNDYQGYTIYSYNDDGILVHTYTYTAKEVEGSFAAQHTNTNVNYTYDDDGTMIKTTTETQSYGPEGDSSSKSIDEKGYVILPNGEKFLAWEYTATYQNSESIMISADDLVDSKYTTHAPSRVGQNHITTITSDGDIAGAVGGQNTGDDRVTPFRNKQAKELINEWDNKVWDSALGEWKNKKMETGTTIYGLSLYDSSFPIHNKDKLIQVTNAIKDLNRKTRETVNVTVYDLEHLIDFNDKIILDGAEYFLVSNTARTTPRIKFEQNLTLVRWY